jgi:spore cortex formation protein SpoVR/YcgB (stage V sporulation)
MDLIHIGERYKKAGREYIYRLLFIFKDDTYVYKNLAKSLIPCKKRYVLSFEWKHQDYLFCRVFD